MLAGRYEGQERHYQMSIMTTKTFLSTPTCVPPALRTHSSACVLTFECVDESTASKQFPTTHYRSILQLIVTNANACVKLRRQSTCGLQVFKNDTGKLGVTVNLFFIFQTSMPSLSAIVQGPNPRTKKRHLRRAASLLRPSSRGKRPCPLCAAEAGKFHTATPRLPLSFALIPCCFAHFPN